MNSHERGPTIETIASGPQPHNIEAEQALLGAILVNNHAYEMVEPLVAAADFFEPIDQQIFDVCASLISAGKRATPVLLNTYMPADLDIAGLTLAQYLARLAAASTTIINAVDYAKTVRDLANRRRVMGVLEDGAAILRDAPPDMAPEEIAADTIERIDEIITGQVPQQLRAISMGGAAREAMEQLSDALAGNCKAAGMTSGLADLDRRTDGIHRGELSILAGRPGMCKTALGVHVALSAAGAGHPTLYWSGEMMGAALAQRALTAVAYKISHGRRRIAYSDLRVGRGISDDDFALLRDAQDYLGKLPLVIEQQPGLTIAQIAMRARRLKQKKGLDLLIIDHLHKIRAADRYRGDATAEIGEISNACAALAKELNIGVLALCQLSRKTEEREDKRPMLADLRQSGNLEQDADVVIFPFREAYYLLQREPAMGTVEQFAWQDRFEAVQNRLEINVAKQRQGATGTFDAFCAIEANVISDAARDDSGAGHRAEAAE